MKCPHCDFDQVPEGARFCPNCGQEMPSPKQPDVHIDVDLDVDQVEAGASVTGVEIDDVYGDVYVHARDQAAIRNRRNKLALLQRVRTARIEDQLARIEAVYAGFGQQNGLIRLPKRWQPEAVDYVAEPAGELAFLDAESPELSPDSEAIDIFDQAGHSLLILGEPGSGKTVLLLQLARALIEQAEQDFDAPIPVVLNLSSWAGRRGSIADWVVYELNLTEYGVPKEIGRRWLKNNELVLLLDGLDEVSPHHRQECVQAINRFVAGHGLTGIAVSSRLAEYDSLKTRLKLRGAILLEALTDQQIDAYFDAAGSSLAGLRAALQQDVPLREMVRSPLLLLIMSLAYRNVAAAELTAGQAEGLETRRRRLFDDYVARMFRYRPEHEKPYPDRQTRAWLSWLARQMDEHGQVTFLIEQLQPSWLPTIGWQRAYMMISRLLVGLIGGLMGGIVIGLALAPGDGLSHALLRGLVEGVGGGLIAGPVAGLVDMAWITRIGPRPKISALSQGRQMALRIPLTSLAVGLSVALIFGLLFGGLFDWLGWGWLGWLMEGMSVGTLFGLGSGLIFAFGPRGIRQSLSNDIQTVEQLSWSLSGARQGAMYGVIAGVAAGAIAGVVAQWTPLVGPLFALGFSGLSIVLLMMLMGLVFLGLIGVVFGGLSGTLVKARKVSPNQGLRLSLFNAGVVAPLIGLAFGLAGWLLGRVVGNAVPYGLYGLFVGVLAALWYGGLFILQHVTLRLMLWVTGKTPRPGRLADFLDYAAQRIFLQRVGGGYIFVHRYLLEHFAAMREA